MLSEVTSYYGVVKDFAQAGWYETGPSGQVTKELNHEMEIRAGKLLALSGVVGSGKTTMLRRRVQAMLSEDKEILVSKSLSVDKGQLSLPVLINALFYNLATEKDFKPPRSRKSGGVSCVNWSASGPSRWPCLSTTRTRLHPKTLVGLKRLIEVVRDGGGTLSIVLAGHPKLKNDLRRPTMEEIGSRAAVFDLEGFGGDRPGYLEWLLAQSLGAKTKTEAGDKVAAALTPEALDLLANRLATPLQFETYLTRL